MKIIRFLGGSYIYVLFMMCTGPPVNSIGLNDQPSTRNNQFLNASNSHCNEVWREWPQLHAQATINGTFIMYEPYASVGNLFLTFFDMLPVIRFLEVGIVLDWKKYFPGFRQAFEPSEIMWDIDPGPLKQRAHDIQQGINAVGFHAAIWNDGLMVISDKQFERLISTLGINARTLPEVASTTNPPNAPPALRKFFNQTHQALLDREYVRAEPCTWNMFLRRSSLLLQSLDEYNPWVTRHGLIESEGHQKDYIGWHIRTPHGESKLSYSPNIHKYILQESAELVCPAFEAATAGIRTTCPELFMGDMEIYISSTSKSMALGCIEDLAKSNIRGVQVDMGLGPRDSHTKFSQNPNAALNAFIDYIFLLDASVIVNTGSSFSNTVAMMNGFTCFAASNIKLPRRTLHVCTPKSASC